MATKGAVEKQKRREKLAARMAARRARLRAMTRDVSVPVEERFAAQLRLAELPRNGSRVRLRNRCKLTGRPRGNYRKFGISRIALRELASQGEIPGMLKASW